MIPVVVFSGVWLYITNHRLEQMAAIFLKQAAAVDGEQKHFISAFHQFL